MPYVLTVVCIVTPIDVISKHYCVKTYRPRRPNTNWSTIKCNRRRRERDSAAVDERTNR